MKHIGFDFDRPINKDTLFDYLRYCADWDYKSFPDAPLRELAEELIDAGYVDTEDTLDYLEHHREFNPTECWMDKKGRKVFVVFNPGGNRDFSRNAYAYDQDGNVYHANELAKLFHKDVI